MFQKFREAGFCVIPSKNGFPLVKWSAYIEKLPDIESVKTWSGNYELVCGKVSGVIGIDIDTDNKEIINRIETIAGISPVKKFGTKGFTAFYKYNGETSNCWKQDGKVVLELLSNKRLCCIPPSTHRITGKSYIWLDKELIGTELPLLGNGFIEIMDVLFPKPKYEYVENYKHHESVDLDKAQEMLNSISADCPRDEWLRVGMALRSEFGDTAIELWHNWSQGGKSYNQRDASTVWRSFNSSGVSIGTLVFMAKQAGWLPVTEYKKPEIKKEEKTKKEEIKIGGLVGAIADWITETAIKPQPMLSLAAALAFVGTLKGHRIQGATGLRTNLLVLSLAPSTFGKEYPQYCINQLAELCDLDTHMMGEPTSGAALLSGINKAKGVALLCLDEIGRYLANISLKNTGGYQREIVDYTIKLFSSANRTFRGKQYANEKENPQIILYQPHFCFLGSTVQNKLANALTSSEMIDGFLNRWIVFNVTERVDESYGKKSKIPPLDLVDKINNYISTNPIRYSSNGKPEPKEIRLEHSAFIKLKQFKEDMIKLVDSENYPINMLYARAGEHCEKIALTLCDCDEITLQNIEDAIIIVNQSNDSLRLFAQGVSDNQHESDLIYILEKIKEHKKITKNHLTKITRKINQKIRNDILNQLIESEQIAVEKVAQKTIIHWIE